MYQFEIEDVVRIWGDGPVGRVIDRAVEEGVISYLVDYAAGDDRAAVWFREDDLSPAEPGAVPPPPAGTLPEPTSGDGLA